MSFAKDMTYHPLRVFIHVVKVDIPLIVANEVTCQSKDVVTPINTKISNIIMSTQVNHDKIKTHIKKGELIRVC